MIRYVILITILTLCISIVEANIDNSDLDFCGKSVLVTISQKIGGINKVHDKSFFEGVDILEINDLMRFTKNINEISINLEKFRQILLLTLPINDKQNVLNVVEKIRSIDGIDYAEPSYYYEILISPNDPYYTSGQLWGMDKIQAPLAWSNTRGDHSVKVGVIDTGMTTFPSTFNGVTDNVHPDLSGNLVNGWDFYLNRLDTIDINGHGRMLQGL